MAGTTSGRTTDRGQSADPKDDVVTIVLDRRTAENIYYSLALALGGVGLSESARWFDGKKGKAKGRPKGNGKGKVPPKTYGRKEVPKGW